MDADKLTQYAIELRYPEEEFVEQVKSFVIEKLKMGSITFK